MLEFLSTPSARRATQSSTGQSCRNAHFYPRPPRGGRPFSEWLFSKSSIVFLSTPSARRATFSPHDDAPRPRNFYPRPPRGGRHVAVDLFSSSVEISIHALREEGDCTAPAGISIEWDFYPRPPRGGRRPSRRDRGSIYSISIHALREEGDPGYVQGRPAAFCISIHALREEGDLWMICFCWSMEISIHALRAEGDAHGAARKRAQCYFYPRPPRGGRP